MTVTTEIMLDGIDAGASAVGEADSAERLAAVLALPSPAGAVLSPEPAAAARGGGAGREALPASEGSLPDLGAVYTDVRRALRTSLPLVLADGVGLSLAGLVACAALGAVASPAVAPAPWAAVAALSPLIVVFWLAGLYSEIWVHPVIEFRQLTRVGAAAALGAAAGAAAAGAWGVSLWYLLAWPVLACVVPLLRTVARHACIRFAWWGYPTLVVGSGRAAHALLDVLLDARRCGLRPVLMTDPSGACRGAAVPVVNDATALDSLVRERRIRHAVLSLPDVSNARMSEVLDRFSGLLPHVLVLSDAATLPTLWGASRSSGRLSGLEVRNGLMLATLRAVKRLLDVTVAAAAICLAAPLFVAVAVVIRLTSRGPVFYGHTRIGRHGRRFRAWKFRTMRTDGDAVLLRHFETDAAARDEWARDQKLRRDPRVTWFGRLLRMTSLDELPQVWNVLRGDMSIVGPRPIVAGEVARYGEIFTLYTTVKPGITGLWQVSGRNDVSYEGRVLLDQFYIRHWSPWLDVYILAKTLVALVRREGAY
jgi:Undecaprenyl-phosphate galactose phosphotransferase WbaP